MAYTNVIEAFRTLKLHGMAETFIELSETAGFSQLTKESLLDALTRSELSDRKARSINYQLASAKFPVARDLNGFDFTQAEVKEEQIRMLYEGHFIEQRRNIVFVGGTGTGKSHLGTAIASQAVKNGRKARFFNVVDLVNQVRAGKIGRPCRVFSRPSQAC